VNIVLVKSVFLDMERNQVLECLHLERKSFLKKCMEIANMCDDDILVNFEFRREDLHRNLEAPPFWISITDASIKTVSTLVFGGKVKRPLPSL